MIHQKTSDSSDGHDLNSLCWGHGHVPRTLPQFEVAVILGVNVEEKSAFMHAS